MKLRSLICVSAVMAAIAASADTTVAGGNTFARLPVTSPFANSIIAIPFSGCGETSTHIYVTNLVQTTGLTQGDTLMYKNGANWYAWRIDASGNWQELTTSTEAGGISFTPVAGATALDCGKACWLYRSNSSGTVYLYGQKNSSLPGVTVAAGTASAITYTIVGYPNEAAALDLSSWSKTGMAEGDVVIVPDSNGTGQKTYRYNGSAWTKATDTTSTVKTPRGEKTVTTTSWTTVAAGQATIAPGCGFMYGRKAQSELPLTWD